MTSSSPISRRGLLLAGGLVAVGGFIGPERWTPHPTRVYQSASGRPEQRKQTNPPQIVAGEPSFDVPVPTAEAVVFRSTAEADRRMNWDALLTEQASEPYRTIGPQECTSVVVAVLPAASKLVSPGANYIRNGTVQHTIAVRDRSQEHTLSTEKDGPIRRYMLTKWALAFHPAPTDADVKIVDEA